MSDTIASNARLYWTTWSVLLVMTLMMLLLDGAELPRPALLVIMLGAMSVKATLIAANFMHLRHERLGLVVTVVLGLFLMAFVLYALMAPDAIRLREMTARP
jgi:cytochrome c oxidase subunit IV